jgi:hypothetical protein
MPFLDEINADIQWRMSELASLKTIPLRYNLLSHHKEILIKYTIPSIYSLWEGFVKNTFELYIREINQLDIRIEDIHINVLTHSLTGYDKLNLENPRMSFTKKIEFVEFYQKTINNPLYLNVKTPTKSNVNYEVINEILFRFNLKQLPDTFKGDLSKLLQFRNGISHGEKSYSVTIDDINSFSALVIDLMVEIFISIENGYKNQTFKK